MNGVRPSLLANSAFFENRELPDQFAVGASRVRSSCLDVDLAPVCRRSRPAPIAVQIMERGARVAALEGFPSQLTSQGCKR